MPIDEITKRYKEAEKNKIFPFFEWQRKDIFENLIKDLLIDLGYNPDDFYYEDSEGIIEIKIRKDLKVIIYLSSLQEKERFLSNKTCAPFNTCPDPETGKPAYEIAVVTNFDTWFFYFEGKEIYAVSAERLEKEWETIKQLISKEAIESGKYKEFARKLLHKEDNKPLREELNLLRIKIANKILQEKTNIYYLKNQDGSYNNEILNEITTRWITRFVSLKLAEDFGVEINFTLKDIRRSFELLGKTAKPLSGAKVKEETLSNAIRALMSEFERRYNGGIFMYKEGVDYITIPDTAFFDLLDFATGWAFPIEDARIIGFIYERFLGQEIVVEREKDKLEAVLKNIGEARGKRKAGGIYYTPKYIVDYIVENTLGEILKEKKEKMNNAVKKLDCDSFLLSLKEAKSLKVLDPACGSGSFLIKVLAEFKNFYEEVKDKARELEEGIEKLKREKTKGNLLFTDDKEVKELLVKYSKIKKELEEIKFPGTFALTHNIYGVDLDPKAIDITAFTLMVQVYDELKNGARCPTMINENLKVGNSLVSAITPDKRNGFISRAELERFKDDISNLIKLREMEKRIDLLDESGLKKLIEENFEDIVDVYISIKEKYPNAIPTPQQKLLDEWSKRAKKEPIEKTFDVLIRETGLARIFLKELYFERIERIKEKIEFEINKPLIKYFNSQKRVLKDKELDEILADKEKLREELKFVKDRATEISKSQPPKVFNWELEFPEVFFNEDGTLKENPGFDCVVGNPPYIRVDNLSILDRESLKNLYSSYIYGKWDIYYLFYIKNINLLREEGVMGYVTSNKFLIADSAKILRRIFLDYKILTILDLSGIKVFTGSNPPSLIFIFKKEKPHNFHLIKVNIWKEVDLPAQIRTDSEINAILSYIFENLKFYNVSQERFLKDPEFLFSIGIPDDRVNLIEKIEQGRCLIDICETISEGDVSPKEERTFTLHKKSEKYLKVISSGDIERFFINWRGGYILPYQRISQKPRLLFSDIAPRLEVALDFGEYRCLRKVYCAILKSDIDLHPNYILGVLNSQLMQFYYSSYFYITRYGPGREGGFRFRTQFIKRLPIFLSHINQQAPIISLVDAIIQKKKEYHSISQNIEDYIDFKEAKLLRLDEFLKKTTEGFEVLSSLEVKNDNFDALRVRIEGDEIILEYGIKRKIEEYEEIDEEEAEVKGKYVIDWNSAGEGKIKDIEAIEFLSEVLEGIRNFSQAKQKSIWQKIAEVKIPEFNEKVKEGFLKFKSAMKKAKELDGEILRIDRAIDRLVYDLYGLTEEEIQVVEKSVWGDKFEEMYSKLPSRENALKLAGECKNG
jgi:type I restriction-modification system DNA methylase subunit